MTKKNTISIKLSVYQAAVVRQVLFEAQKGYSYEHVPQRITEMRAVITDLDESIGDAVE
jgi:hypothetical protein